MHLWECESKRNFQFLLGCFINRDGVGRFPRRRLSIPSRMLQTARTVGCRSKWLSIPSRMLLTVSLSKMKEIIKNFQFLLGCFSLLMREGKLYCLTHFQFLLGCFKYQVNRTNSGSLSLSIPSRMLLLENGVSEECIRELSIPSRMLPV